MDLNDIKKIMKLMDEHGLSHFQFEKDDFNLKLKKGTDIEDIQKILSSLPQGGAASAPAAAAPGVVSPPAAPAAAPESAPAPAGDSLNSPMVGTFYKKPSPEAPDFVKVGDSVSEGQTICIIEAMKVMNEITAEKSGTITEICVEDGNPVQFGDPLFRIS